MAETSTLILKLESAKYNRDLNKAIKNTEKLKNASKDVNRNIKSGAEEGTQSTKQLTTGQIALGTALGRVATNSKKVSFSFRKVFETTQHSFLAPFMMRSKSLKEMVNTITPFGGFNQLNMRQSFKAFGAKGALWKGVANVNDKLDDGAILLDKWKNSIMKFKSQSPLAFGALTIAAGAAAGAITGVFVGLGLVIHRLAKMIKLWTTQEMAIAKLEGVLRATGNVTGFSALGFRKLAIEMQSVTGIADDLIINAQGILATFKNIRGPIFRDTLKVMLDVSKVMGTGLKEEAIRLGKALNDPIKGVSSLREVGVSFNAEQEKTIKNLAKTGKLLEAQKMILKELNAEFGKTSDKMGDTLGGQMQVFSSNIKSVKEGIGGMVAELLHLRQGLKLINNAMKERVKLITLIPEVVKRQSKGKSLMQFLIGSIPIIGPGIVGRMQGKGAAALSAADDLKSALSRILGMGLQSAFGGGGSGRIGNNISTKFVGGATVGSVEASRTAGRLDMRFQSRLVTASERSAETLERIERALTPGWRTADERHRPLGGL